MNRNRNQNQSKDIQTQKLLTETTNYPNLEDTINSNYLNQHSSIHQLKSKSTFWRNAFINSLFIASWYLFATLISIYNKWMFSPEHYNFQYPLFVSACHMYMQFCYAALTLAIFPSIRSETRPTPRDYVKKALPCGMASGLDIGLSNTSLKTVTLSFYTMCKSSSLAFVLMFAFIFKLEKPTYKLTGIIMLITAGVILMVSTETAFEFWGMIEVLSASCLGGLRWSLTQILLDKKSMGMNTPISTIFWLAPTMAVSLSICSMIFEDWHALLSNPTFFGDLVKSLSTMMYIIMASILAYLMTVSEYFLIQRTSVVTLSIAGVFKEVGTIFLSTVIFHDIMTPLNISGLAITILGIALYNFLKYKEASSKKMEDSRNQQDASLVLMNRTDESKVYTSLNESGDELDNEDDQIDARRSLQGLSNDTRHHTIFMSEKKSSLQEEEAESERTRRSRSDHHMAKYKDSDDLDRSTETFSINSSSPPPTHHPY